ncbi:uncharacterized protein LOC133783744 [Humulus lupulus]|uniref:uncharacterized protein LOC133783744 n=1 Tax=Humulus lupulus TaxID=3486 RepID=UPI002B40E79C|nr:uncharacterized protein LOC133783744 [Humulus lupulus]
MAMEMNNNNNNNENNDPNRRVSRGRQKVAMVKMDNESNLQVTFSKRRSGLFKKASELCTLCGAELAIIVFSPGRKVFSFGHPSVELVIDRFLNPQNYRTTPQANSGTLQLIEAHRNANVRELNQQLSHVTGQLDHERKRNNELKKARKARVSLHWWEAPAEALSDLRHLEQLKSAMELLRRATTQQADRLLIQTTANANSLLPPNFNTMNVNTPSFYGSVTNNAGGGGGGGNGQQQPNNYDHYCDTKNKNINDDKKNVGFDGGVTNKNTNPSASTGKTGTDTPQLQAITSGGGSVNHHVNMPYLQAAIASGGGNVNHINLAQIQAIPSGGTINMQVVKSSSTTTTTTTTTTPGGGGNVMSHINFSPMSHMSPHMPPANTCVSNFNHFNMSPAMPHMQPKTSSAPNLVNHVNMSPMQANNNTSVNHVMNQLPMLPQSLPQSSQLLLQQPNSQGTHHHMMFSNNGGFGHGFF